MSRPRLDQPFVIGTVQTPAGEIPRVSAEPGWADRWGTVKARWKVGRMKYLVDPGLYAIGEVDRDSPVLVTANYKMTFDALRGSLQGVSAWILVLNTEGINVWCAAGKGTFSTDELVERIEATGLSAVVSHHTLILPQLAGPGVAAHTVKKLSGFRVRYGPIRAPDIKAYLRDGCTATPEMRRKTFDTSERMVLIPVELVDAVKAAAYIVPILFLVGGIGGPGSFWENLWSHGLTGVGAILTALFAGAVLTPILLPWLPGRSFSVKGVIIGVLAAVVFLALRVEVWGNLSSGLEVVAWLLLIPAAAAYLAMNFTGASTYTSLSGVKREMRVAVPLEIAGAAVGLVAWIASRLIA